MVPPSLYSGHQGAATTTLALLTLGATCPQPSPFQAPPVLPVPLSSALTSACPPGVSVFPQRSQRRHGRCQSLPRDVTFSAGKGERAMVMPRPWRAPPPGWGWMGHSPK